MVFVGIFFNLCVFFWIQIILMIKSQTQYGRYTSDYVISIERQANILCKRIEIKLHVQAPLMDTKIYSPNANYLTVRRGGGWGVKGEKITYKMLICYKREK